jgi:hypothetical protein
MKRGLGRIWIIVIILLLVVSFLTGFVTYFIFFGPDYQENYSGGTVLKNPAAGKSLEEAVAEFDENFVYYFLVSIKAYNLHSPPLSSDLPRIEFYIGEQIYNAKVDEGVIRVGRGEIEDEDIIIRTSTVEAVKMVKSRDYVFDSFANGGSKIGLVTGETELALKGYLKLYEELVG